MKTLNITITLETANNIIHNEDVAYSEGLSQDLGEFGDNLREFIKSDEVKEMTVQEISELLDYEIKVVK